ncbi:pentapeptide repeat-containing protein [Maridesulfovibrio sp.]|uniref:pentapeptide repeat-containing protein n=1 Tax=Maridesulfovibrio sp. TaxID=2795000 RepID=UPI003AFFF3E3
MKKALFLLAILITAILSISLEVLILNMQIELAPPIKHDLQSNMQFALTLLLSTILVTLIYRRYYHIIKSKILNKSHTINQNTKKELINFTTKEILYFYSLTLVPILFWSIFISLWGVLISLTLITIYYYFKIDSKKTTYALYNYSGLRAIYEKINPPSPYETSNTPKPSTFFLWTISIYIAIFGIASNRYEQAVNSYNMQISAFQSQMASDYRAEACINLRTLQKIKIPGKPEILKPWITFLSIIINEKYKEGLDTMRQTIEAYKKNLCEAKLIDANLTGAYLEGANLERADLTDANLYGAILIKSSLKEAKLKNADLHEAIMNEANLQKAFLGGANLQEAILFKADLSEALLGSVPPNENFFKSITGTALAKRLNNFNQKTPKQGLAGANLRGADLQMAILNKTDLRDVNLQNANLSGADIRNTIFIRTNLANANFTNAQMNKLTIYGLSKAKTLYNAILPPKVEKELRQTAPSLFEKPDWYRED